MLFPFGDKESPAPNPVPAERAADYYGSGTILVVDDEETVRTLAGHILENFGFQVLMAADGAEAVAIFAEHHAEISAVLLDMTMPHMGGEEAYRELRQIKPDVRVLLSSGYTEAEATDRFAGKHLAGFIQKPYRATALIEKINEVLAG